jgi:hypothetical protein
MKNKKEWDGFCHRCSQASIGYTMSWFNQELICPDCDKKEHQHPKIEEAKGADWEACKQGNFNFSGIGKPHDL